MYLVKISMWDLLLWSQWTGRVEAGGLLSQLTWGGRMGWVPHLYGELEAAGVHVVPVAAAPLHHLHLVTPVVAQHLQHQGEEEGADQRVLGVAGAPAGVQEGVVVRVQQGQLGGSGGGSGGGTSVEEDAEEEVEEDVEGLEEKPGGKLSPPP